MQETVIIISGFLALHFAAVSSLSLYSGIYVDSLFFVPKKFLLGTYHKTGFLALCCASLIIVISNINNAIDYGIIPAVLLLIFDIFMIARGIIAYKR